MADLTPHPGRLRLAGILLVALLLVLGALWWRGHDGTAEQERASATPGATAGAADATSRGGAEDPRPGTDPDERGSDERATPAASRVVVISVDGLASYAVSATRTPNLQRLLDQGAGTLNARTAVERTVTLPNHTGMVTGRRIDAVAGGHGVTWNVPTRRNVRRGVSSVFASIDAAGGSTAVFAGKGKFRMWDRSWPGTIDRFVVEPTLNALTDAVLDDLVTTPRDLVFFHIAAPDAAGHRSGWGSRPYTAAVASADAAVGRVMASVSADPERSESTILIVTADHGGTQGTRGHADPTLLVDYQVPFVVWGAGIPAGDLYDLNPDYLDPGDGRPGYEGPQPVRNAAVANLALDLLGLPAVPGSLVDVRQDLDVR